MGGTVGTVQGQILISLNGQDYQVERSRESEDILAIAWTDPEGTPHSAQYRCSIIYDRTFVESGLFKEVFGADVSIASPQQYIDIP